jgi:hypothetical protein
MLSHQCRSEQLSEKLQLVNNLELGHSLHPLPHYLYHFTLPAVCRSTMVDAVRTHTGGEGRTSLLEVCNSASDSSSLLSVGGISGTC